MERERLRAREEEKSFEKSSISQQVEAERQQQQQMEQQLKKECERLLEQERCRRVAVSIRFAHQVTVNLHQCRPFRMSIMFPLYGCY